MGRSVHKSYFTVCSSSLHLYLPVFSLYQSPLALSWEQRQMLGGCRRVKSPTEVCFWKYFCHVKFRVRWSNATAIPQSGKQSWTSQAFLTFRLQIVSACLFIFLSAASSSWMLHHQPHTILALCHRSFVCLRASRLRCPDCIKFCLDVFRGFVAVVYSLPPALHHEHQPSDCVCVCVRRWVTGSFLCENIERVLKNVTLPPEEIRLLTHVIAFDLILSLLSCTSVCFRTEFRTVRL